MKKIISSALVVGALPLLFATGAMAAQVTMTFHIPSLQCASAGARATASAESVSGVIKAVDDPDSTSLTVTFDDTKTTAGKITDALNKDNLTVEGKGR